MKVPIRNIGCSFFFFKNTVKKDGDKVRSLKEIDSEGKHIYFRGMVNKKALMQIMKYLTVRSKLKTLLINNTDYHALLNGKQRPVQVKHFEVWVRNVGFVAFTSMEVDDILVLIQRFNDAIVCLTGVKLTSQLLHEIIEREIINDLFFPTVDY